MGDMPTRKKPNRKKTTDRFYRLAAMITKRFEKRFDTIGQIDSNQHPIKYITSFTVKATAKIVGVVVAAYHFFELFRIHL